MPAKRTKAQARHRSTANSKVSAANKASGKRTSSQKKSSSTKKSAPEALTFRLRTPADDDFILNLTEGELGDVHREAFGEVFPRDQFFGYLQSGAPTVVVEQSKQPIGYFSYLVSPDGKMHVTGLVIDAKHQQGGIGSQVMARLEDDARHQNVHTLEVFVQENNKRSVAFTKSLGFTEVYRIPPNSICFQKVIARTDGTSVAVGRTPTGAPPMVRPDEIPPW